MALIRELRAALQAALTDPRERGAIALPPGGNWREAAVVLPLLSDGGTARLLLIQRPHSLRTHAGQFAFPGGSRDPEESLEAAALRELEEELAIGPMQVELLGTIDPVPTSSRFFVTPFVGWISERIEYRPAKAEVDRVIEVPLGELIHSVRHWTEPREYEGRRYSVHFYDYQGEVIWGATGQMLWDFLQRVAVLPAAKEL